MATHHGVRAPPNRPFSFAGIPAQGMTDTMNDLETGCLKSPMEKLDENLSILSLDSSQPETPESTKQNVSDTTSKKSESTESVLPSPERVTAEVSVSNESASSSNNNPPDLAKSSFRSSVSLARGLLSSLKLGAKPAGSLRSELEPGSLSESESTSSNANSSTVALEDSLHSRLVADPATYIGPNDFNEKNFHESVSLYDYATLGAILGTLPSVVVMEMMWKSCRKLYMPRHVSLRDAAFDSAANHVASLCNWPQLRRLCPVRPLREELQLARFKNLPNYNHYFGGTNYSARWLVEHPNRQRSDPVMLYMHGGSYALKVQRPQLKYLVSLHKSLLPANVSILVLDYTIGPFAKYPTQLNEGMACYEDLRKSCDNIIFFGDSAGGHLALSMLLSGASCEKLVLVSPSTDMTSGLRDDIMMREAFVDTEKYRYSDPIISPLFADPRIWAHKIPKDSAIVWGSAEPCKLQMHDFAVVARIPHVFEELGGSHDCILRGTQNPGSQFIYRFLKSSLSSQPTSTALSSPQAKACTRANSMPPASKEETLTRKPSLRRSLSYKIQLVRELSPRSRESSPRANSEPNLGLNSEPAPPLPLWKPSAVNHTHSRASPVPNNHKNLKLVTTNHGIEPRPPTNLHSPVSRRAMSVSPPRSSPTLISPRTKCSTPLPHAIPETKTHP